MAMSRTDQQARSRRLTRVNAARVWMAAQTQSNVVLAGRTVSL